MTTPIGMNQKAVVNGIELRLDTAILGLQTALPAGTAQINIGTRSYAVADAIKLAQGVVQHWKDSRQAHAVIRQVAQSRKEDFQAGLGFLSDLKAGLVVMLGRESEELTKFGFKPQHRRRPLTIEEKARRAAKATLTREKRHTMGSRQKEGLKATGTPEISIPADGHMKIVDGNGTNGSPVAEAPKPAANPTHPA